MICMIYSHYSTTVHHLYHLYHLYDLYHLYHLYDRDLPGKADRFLICVIYLTLPAGTRIKSCMIRDMLPGFNLHYTDPAQQRQVRMYIDYLDRHLPGVSNFRT